jgi:hypothetical protein
MAASLPAAVSLYYMHYNFARPHKSLSTPYPKTPAMAAGVADHVWSLKEIAELLEVERPVEEEPPAGEPGRARMRQSFQN